MRIAALLCIFCPVAALAAGLDVTADDLGEIYQFSKTKAQLYLSNTSPNPVELLSVEPARKEDRVLAFGSRILPGESQSIPVSISTENDLGIRFHSFKIKLREPGSAEYVAQVRVFGLSVLDGAPHQIDFGVVEAESGSDFSVLNLTSKEVEHLQAEAILDVPDFVDAKLSDDRKSLKMRVKPSISWGLHNGHIRLRINSTKQEFAPIEVRADVHGTVVPDANPFNFGVARVSAKNVYRIRMSSTDGADFKVSSVRLQGFQGRGRVVDCVPAKLGCKLLEFQVDGDQPTGRVVGTALVDLPKFGQVLPIRIWGMLLSDDTKIVSLDDAVKDTSDKSSNPPSGEGVRGVRLSDALKNAVNVKPDSKSVPPGSGPLLRWTVDNDQGIYGYVVYRGVGAEGPMSRVNDKIIKAQEGESPENSYAWRDSSAIPGRDYWYQVGIIYNDGHRKDLTGVVKIRAK